MKPIIRVFSALAFVIILFQLASCRKIVDKIFKKPDGDIKFCNIKKVTLQATPLSDPYTYEFTYNALGDPVKAITDDPGTSRPNFYFRYDDENRLTDYIGLYENGQYESWHKYGYDASGLAVKDTQWVFGTFGPEPDPASFSITEHTYEYDALKRIVKRTSVDLIGGGAPDVTTYTYDAEGNLAPGTYDDHVNFHRTNRIWMFVDRDYSKNLPIPAVSYNSWDLPLEFDTFATPTTYNFLGQAVNISSFEYACP
jgi:hypothetical protein